MDERFESDINNIILSREYNLISDQQMVGRVMQALDRLPRSERPAAIEDLKKRAHPMILIAVYEYGERDEVAA